MEEQLHTLLAPWLMQGMPLHSRVHAVRQYIPWQESRAIYIKRDDELSSGITGSKYRKFAGLLPYLIQSGCDEVLVIGSAQSNNVSGLLQLLNEHALPVRLMLLKGHASALTGNLLWTSLLYPLEEVMWVEREQWPDVNALAAAYVEEQSKEDKKVIVLPEGAAVPHAAIGAMSLAADILQNEKETGLYFDHIQVDSGTGTTAAGLLMGLAGAQSRIVHITLIAGDEDYFWAQLNRMCAEVSGLLDKEIVVKKENIRFYEPSLAPSFGSVNQSVLQEVKTIARQEGILMDPLYGVKHFYTAKEKIIPAIGQGSILFVNSGGSLGLAGFQDKLASL